MKNTESIKVRRMILLKNLLLNFRSTPRRVYFTLTLNRKLNHFYRSIFYLKNDFTRGRRSRLSRRDGPRENASVIFKWANLLLTTPPAV